jgi:hypothetical protein
MTSTFGKTYKRTEVIAASLEQLETVDNHNNDVVALRGTLYTNDGTKLVIFLRYYKNSEEAEPDFDIL